MTLKEQLPGIIIGALSTFVISLLVSYIVYTFSIGRLDKAVSILEKNQESYNNTVLQYSRKLDYILAVLDQKRIVKIDKAINISKMVQISQERNISTKQFYTMLDILEEKTPIEAEGILIQKYGFTEFEAASVFSQSGVNKDNAP